MDSHESGSDGSTDATLLRSRDDLFSFWVHSRGRWCERFAVRGQPGRGSRSQLVEHPVRVAFLEFKSSSYDENAQLQFQARQEAAAARRRAAACGLRASRAAAPMPLDADGDVDDAASAATRRQSLARSVHPSCVGSAISMACSEATIGPKRRHWLLGLHAPQPDARRPREAAASASSHSAGSASRSPSAAARSAAAGGTDGECFSQSMKDPRSRARRRRTTLASWRTQFDETPARKAGGKIG